MLFTKHNTSINDYLQTNGIQQIETSLLCLLCCKEVNQNILKYIQVQRQINQSLSQQEQLLLELVIIKFLDDHNTEKINSLIQSINQETIWKIFKVVNYLTKFEVDYFEKIINIFRHHLKLNIFDIIGYISINDKKAQQLINKEQDEENENKNNQQQIADVYIQLQNGIIQQFLKYCSQDPIVIQHFSNGTNIETFLNIYKYIKRQFNNQEIQKQILDIIVHKLNQLQNKTNFTMLNDILGLDRNDISFLYHNSNDFIKRTFITNNVLFNILDAKEKISNELKSKHIDHIQQRSFYTFNGFILRTKQNTQNVIKQYFAKNVNNNFTLIFNMHNLQTADGEILSLGTSSNQIEITIKKNGSQLVFSQAKKHKNIELTAQISQISIYQAHNMLIIYVDQHHRHTLNIKNNNGINYIIFKEIVVEYIHITEQLIPIQSLITFQKDKQYRKPIFGQKMCNILAKQLYKQGFIIQDREYNNIELHELIKVEQYNSEYDQLQFVQGNIKVAFKNKYTSILSQQILFQEKFVDEIINMINYHGKCAINYAKLQTIDLQQDNNQLSYQVDNILYNVNYTSQINQTIEEHFNLNQQKSIIYDSILAKQSFNIGTFSQLFDKKLQLQYITYHYDKIKENHDLQEVLCEIDKTLFVNHLNIQILLSKYYEAHKKNTDINYIYYLRNSLINTQLLKDDFLNSAVEANDKHIIVYLFTSGYLYSINTQLLNFMVKKLKTLKKQTCQSRKCLIRLFQKVFYVIFQHKGAVQYQNEEYSIELHNTLKIIVKKQHQLPYIQQYQQKQQIRCLQILYSTLFHGFFDNKLEIKYYLIIINLISNVFNSQDIDILQDKTQFRNLKHFVFSLLKTNIEEGIQLIIQDFNIILALIALEYIIYISDKTILNTVDIQALCLGIIKHEQNSTAKKTKDLLQLYIEEKYFNLPLQENYKVGQLHSAIIISLLYIGLKQYQQNEESIFLVKLYLMALQMCINNQIYQNEMLIFYDQNSDIYICYKLFCTHINLILLQYNDLNYSQYYNKKLNDGQLGEIKRLRDQIVTNKNSKEFLVQLSINMLQNIKYVSIETIQLQILYKYAQVNNQTKANEKLFNIYMSQIKALLLDGNTNILKYDIDMDLYIKLLPIEDNIGSIFENMFYNLQTIQTGYGIQSSIEKSTNAQILLYFASKIPKVQQIPMFIKKVATQFTMECVKVCVTNDRIQDQQKFFTCLSQCLNDNPESFVEVMSAETSLSNKIIQKKEKTLNKFIQEKSTINQQTIYSATLLQNFYTLNQDCIQLFHFHQDEEQISSYYNIETFINQQYIQYHISLLTSLITSLTDHYMKCMKQYNFEYSRQQLRESKLRSKNHRQLIFNDIAFQNVISEIKEKIVSLVPDEKLYASTFVPFNDKLLFVVDICYYSLSNISGECGILICTLQHIIFVPCVKIKTDSYIISHQSDQEISKSNTNFEYHIQFSKDISDQAAPIQAVFSNFAIYSDIQLEIMCHQSKNLQDIEQTLNYKKQFSQILGQMIVIDKNIIKNIQNRYFAHRESAFEIFTTTGYTFQFHILDCYVEFIRAERYICKKEQKSAAVSHLNSELARGIMLQIFKSYLGLETEGLHFSQDVVAFVRERRSRLLQLYSYFGQVLYSPELCAGDQRLYSLLARNLNQGPLKYSELIREHFISLFEKCITQRNSAIIKLDSCNDILYKYLTKDARQAVFKQLSQASGSKEFFSDILFQLYDANILTAKQFIQYVNQLSCRSPNDLMMYPIFPVVKNRKLQLPVQAQTIERQSMMLSRQKQINDMLKINDTKEFQYTGSVLLNCDVYMNGTFASNPASIIYFCCRQQPYTSALIDLQAGKFDSPDRMFHSYYCLYDNIFDTNHNEHILPLFESLYIYYNTFKFEFGKRNDGKNLEDLDCEYKNDSLIKSPFQVLFELNYNIEHANKQDISQWLKLFFGDKQHSVDVFNAYQSQLYYYKEHTGNKNKQEIDKIRYFGSVVKPIYQLKNQSDKTKAIVISDEETNNNINNFYDQLLQESSKGEQQQKTYSVPTIWNENTNVLRFDDLMIHKSAKLLQVQEYVSNKIILNKKQVDLYIESSDMFNVSNQIKLNSNINIQYDEFAVKFYHNAQPKLLLAVVEVQSLIHKIYVITDEYLLIQTIHDIISLKISFLDVNNSVIEVKQETIFSCHKIFTSSFSAASSILYMVIKQSYPVEKGTTQAEYLIAFDCWSHFILDYADLEDFNLKNIENADLQVNEDDYVFIKIDSRLVVFSNEFVQLLDTPYEFSEGWTVGASIFGTDAVAQVDENRLLLYIMMPGNADIKMKPIRHDTMERNENLLIYGHAFERANNSTLESKVCARRIVSRDATRLVQTNMVEFQNKIISIYRSGNFFCVQLINGETFSIERQK